MNIDLDQRGRASIDFLVTFGRESAACERLLNRDIAECALVEDDLADDLDERLGQMEAALANSWILHMRDLFHEWSATQHGLIAIEAFEAIRSSVEPRLRALAEGPTQIRTMPHFTSPAYLENIWIHRTHGGWDGHEHQGFIHAEMIHKRYLTAMFGGGIFNMRRSVLDHLPRRDYRRVFEIGSSSGFHTLALADAFPQAHISGCDVSRPMLEQAQRVANERGLEWDLYVARGEDTRLPGASFDLVSSFIVLHELPAEVIQAVFMEAFRLLEPGGSIIMTDVPPSWSQTKLEAWRYDRGARRGGEPYWREAGLVDTAALASAAGFGKIRAFREPSGGHYWVTMGEKPK